MAGWKDFTSWCIESRCAGLPAVAVAHRLGKRESPVLDPLVKATLKQLAREYKNPRKQAR